MRKLPRPVEPEGYAAASAAFVQVYPPAQEGRTESKRWENFKNEHQAVYARVKAALYTNQSELCAFCECTLRDTNREIEHFMPKCLSKANCDHTVDFRNFTMSCKGRRTRNEDDHCGHLKDNINPTGQILNPYELPDFPLVKCIVIDNKLRFEPDKGACEKAGVSPELVACTLKCLGLNCLHLQGLRGVVWEELLNDQKEETLEELQARHLTPVNGELKQFYTTRLLALS